MRKIDRSIATASRDLQSSETDGSLTPIEGFLSKLQTSLQSTKLDILKAFFKEHTIPLPVGRNPIFRSSKKGTSAAGILKEPKMSKAVLVDMLVSWASFSYFDMQAAHC
jgi:hypothetical protein